MHEVNKSKTNWTHRDATALYGIEAWGHDYFSISKNGELQVHVHDQHQKKLLSINDIVNGLSERGIQLPVLLRFRDLLDARITEINQAFNKAITELNYQGSYYGVYPIKVNQQREVINEITRFGAKYNYGLECGSKAELILALGYLQNENAYLVCNGYKDEEFIDLALNAQKMGSRVIIVLEMPSELDMVLQRSAALGIRPTLGIRVRLSTSGSGHWSHSAGDASVFGLNAPQVIDTVDRLREAGYLDCLRMLHYHQGSQIPNISSIRTAVNEATRMYVDLVAEGAPMGLLDIGGGLAVDYDGSHSDSSASCNYSVEEYCADVVEMIQLICDRASVAHPDIISESGRATVAYYSVLVFNVLDVNLYLSENPIPPLDKNSPVMLRNLAEVYTTASKKNLQESLNDAVYYRDQIRDMFFHGTATLRQRSIAEHIHRSVLGKVSRLLGDTPPLSEEMQKFRDRMVDYYYGNFSLFQSLPDAWAIDQFFPVVPIQRLDERPTRNVVLADITCDCDGKIDRFFEPDSSTPRRFLPLHDIGENENYCVAVFLVGAYQETLGDLHNLLGDTNIVGVHYENSQVAYTHEVEGDTVADVLSYVEYDPRELLARFRQRAEDAVSRGLLTPQQRREIIDTYRSGLHGYTYFES